MTTEYGKPQSRTSGQKEALDLRLEKLIDMMQNVAEIEECSGNHDVFAILDTAAERLRELCR